MINWPTLLFRLIGGVTLWLATAGTSLATVQIVDDFEDGERGELAVQNRLGGYRNTFARQPSTVVAERDETIFRGKLGKSLCITAHRQRTGFCGQWIHLFDMRARPRQFFDARPFKFLSFWVKGAHGGERFEVKLADRTWIGREDAVTAGRIDELLPGGVTTEWREVLVPLARVSLDRQALGGLTLDFSVPGEHTIFVDDIAFKSDNDENTPTTNAPAAPADTRQFPRMLWVWSTETLLRDERSWRELLTFSREQQITQLWMQLGYRLADESEPPVDDAASPQLPRRRLCEIRQTAELRRFLRAAHAAGMAVHALDGYPEFCQRDYHHVPLAVVEGVIAFNRAGSPNERFDGVHFDNEPYLLVGWQDRDTREQILREFLELNEACQAQVRQAGGLEFGVDIPFWWQERDEATGEYNGLVTFHGKRQPASFHCIDLLDNVGIMNYRDTADGADGMIAHGRDLLAYADKAQRAKVYMGVETFAYPPTEVWFALGPPKPAFLDKLRHEGHELSRLSRLREFRLRTLDDGDNMHLGLELPGEAKAARRDEARHVLSDLSQRFHTNPRDARKTRNAVSSFIEKDPEWTGYRDRDIVDSDSGESHPGFSAESLTLSKITFADDRFEQMQSQLRQAEAFFGKFRSYGGLAIHHYETFRAKVEERPEIPTRRREP